MTAINGQHVELRPYGENMPVLDVDDVIELEGRIADGGTPLSELMNRAGSALALSAKRACDKLDATRPHVVVLAGSGNNGGDGWVAAGLLARENIDVALVTIRDAADIDREPAASAAARTAALENGPSIIVSPGVEQARRLIDEADVIIDALLGTGFSHERVRPPACIWIDAVNAARRDRGAYVIAADAPSGANAQTGSCAQPCIEADETVTMIAAKPGLLAEPARAAVGELLVAPLFPGASIPPC